MTFLAVMMLPLQARVHATGPQGGSYHFVCQWTQKKEKISIYAEWIVRPDGNVSIAFQSIKNGVRVNEPQVIRTPISVWVSPLGKEGLSAKKMMLQTKDKTLKSAQNIPVSEVHGTLPEKVHNTPLYVVIPEININNRIFRWAGEVRVLPSKPINTNQASQRADDE